MASLIHLLDNYIFSGVPSNAVYDVIKMAWEKINQKSWEDMYLDAFEAAVEEARPCLQRYCGDDGEVGLDTGALSKTLHRDLYVGPGNLTLSTLSTDEFTKQLAEAMEERSVLVIGGNKLSLEDYAQLTRNLVRHATNRFRTTILANEIAFRQALLDEVQGNEALIGQVRAFLAEHFDLVLEKLEIIEAGVQQVERKVDELPARIEQVVRDATRSALDVTIERDQLKLELKTERERRWQDRYQELRAQVNAGYVTAARSHIVALADEIENRVQAGNSISPELMGRIYRLAASAFVPGKPGGDLQRCRNYLIKARASSSNEGLVQCQIIEALIAYHTHGLHPALALLEGLDGEEVARLRFSLYLENDQLAECRHMIEQGEVDESRIIQDSSWARTFALYYAAVGDQGQMNHALEALIAEHPTADHYQVAGLALTRVAFERFRQFCLDNHVLPEFQIMLDLDDLVDQAACDRATDYFAKASELYQLHNCHTDAVRTLTAALRLQMDTPESSRSKALVQRLQQLDPDNPLLIYAQEPFTEAEATAALNELEKMLGDPTTDPLLLLHTAHTTAVDPSIAKSIANLLQSHRERFAVSDTTQVQFEFLVLQLLEKAGLEEDAETWPEQMSAQEHHAHLSPLCHVGFYLERDSDKAAEWLAQAQAIAPDQPEVLAISILVYRKQGQYDAAIASAKKLFGLLRTRQTASWLIDALLAGEQWVELLQVIDDTSDLALPADSVHSARAHACLKLNRPPLEAKDDLEWLRAHQKAAVEDLLNLARIYQYLHRADDAIAVLKECVDRYPAEPDGYLELSQALLDEDRRGESFRWAMTARDRFRDDPQVAAHLFYLGFPTGYELREEVGEIFREFVPGGRFADTGFFEQRHVTELVEFVRSHRERVENLENLYRQGQISLMMLCYGLNIPLFRFHFLGAHSQARRFAALGNHRYETGSLGAQWPREVVLDYSALLTLWSLFGEDVLNVLQAHFERIWIPSKLLPASLWEQRQFSQHGQLARYKAQVVLRDRMVQQPSEFTRHARVDPPGGWDVTGAYTEATVAQARGLVHLDEYVPDDREIAVPTIGLQTLADLLYRAGEIDSIEYKALTKHAKPAEPDEEGCKAQLARESEIVADIPTLAQVAMANALDGLCRYFGHVHLSKPAWQKLLQELMGFEYSQQMADELRTLRDLLGNGIVGGFIKAESLTPDQRLIGKLADERRENGGEPDTLDDSILELVFDYVDELLGLAHFNRLPIWTDDRWTCRLCMEERQPAFIFGTDIFLERLRAEGIWEEDKVFAHYGKLIEWGYLGLPIHPEYIRGLLRQGVAPDSKALTDALHLYRESMLELWKASEGDGGFSPEFALQVLSTYNQQLIATMQKCCEDQANAEAAAAVFRLLDLSRYAPKLEGQEPFYLSSLLLNAIINGDHGKSDAAQSLSKTGGFSKWLDGVMLEADVKVEEIDEAWYLLVQYALAMHDSATTELDQQVGLVFLGRLFDAMPEHTMASLLTSNLSERLSEDFGLRLEQHTYFEFTQPDGERTRLVFRQGQWEKDLNQAVQRYLIAPTDAPVTAGVVTIQAHGCAPGSMFLRFWETPTEIVQEHGGMVAGGPIRYLCALSGFLHADSRQRLALWNIGHQKLRDKGLPTDEWMALRDPLLSEQPEIWGEAGHRARRYLLGQWQIAWDYFAEAAALGLPAIIALLPYIEPEVVRAWFDMPQLDWSDEQGLHGWAQKVGSHVVLGFDHARDSTTVPSECLKRFGRSIFPDAHIFRDWITTAIGQADDPKKQQRLIQSLLEAGRSTASIALKANVVLALLEWQAQASATDPSRSFSVDLAIADLIERIALAWGCKEPLQAALTGLEQQLCRYLYTAWSRSLEHSRSQPEELAYLAYTGASFIVDALSGYITEQVVDEVISQLQAQVRHDLLVQGLGEQPPGFFRPIWNPHLNYAISFLLESARREVLDLTSVTSDESLRGPLLECGTAHRILQAHIDNTGMEKSWLDAHLSTDIGSAVAQLFAWVTEEHLTSWSEGQKHAWLVCTIADAGPTLASDALARLPEAENDEDVLKLISMAFLGVRSPGTRWPEYIRDLLATEQLQRIRKSPTCYGELIWHLGELLLESKGLDTQLARDAREVIFEIPAVEPNLAELIEIKADVLSQLAGMGFDLEGITEWLEKVATQEDLPLPVVRSALRPFVRLWPHYRLEVRDALGSAVMEIREEPRICRLWEIHRITRDTRKD